MVDLYSTLYFDQEIYFGNFLVGIWEQNDLSLTSADPCDLRDLGPQQFNTCTTIWLVIRVIKKQKFSFSIGPTSHFIPWCKKIILCQVTKTLEKIAVATRGQSFVCKVYVFLVKYAALFLASWQYIYSEVSSQQVYLFVVKTTEKQILKYLWPISKQPQLFENSFIWCSVFTRIAKTDH